MSGTSTEQQQSLIWKQQSTDINVAYGLETIMEKEQFSPAQLSFFAIYSPPLGPTDETFGDQVVFYYSRSVRDARLKAKATADEDRLSENEKLRQIGLAQGMAGFARYSQQTLD